MKANNEKKEEDLFKEVNAINLTLNLSTLS